MVKTLPSLIASLRHYIALYQGNILPLPGTKRYVGRENPHSLFDSSLFTKSPETPINTGVPRGEEWRTTLHHSSPTLHLDILFSVRRLSSVRRPSGFAIRCKKMFDLWNRGICNPPSIYKQLAKNLGWRVVKSRAHSSPYQNNSYTNTYTTPVKSEECFWNWRIIVTSYSGLQIRKEKVEHFLTADCKSAGTPSGRQSPHALQIRWDA